MKRILFGLLILVAALAVAVPSGFGAWFSDEEVSSGNTFTVAVWDNPPAVTITNPLEGDTVSGTAEITADAADDVGVVQVDFYYDSFLIGSDTNSPYSVFWDSTSVDNGDHTLIAVATDTAFPPQTASDSISVNVYNEEPIGPSPL